MDGKEATFSESRDSDIIVSEETFWKTLVTDEVIKAQLAVGLVHALADNTIRGRYPALRQSIARVWETLPHASMNVDSGLIEDDTIASVVSLELMQQLAEGDYLDVELIAVLSNRLTMLMEMYQESGQPLGAEKEQYFAQMDSFLNSASRRITEHATQSKKQETNHQLYAWKDKLLKQYSQTGIGNEIPIVKKALHVFAEFLKVVNDQWSYPDLQLLQNVLVFCGIPEDLPLTYSHVYGCLLENQELCNELQNLVHYGTNTWELELAEYDTAFYRLLTRIEIQRSTGGAAKKPNDMYAATEMEAYASTILGIKLSAPLKPFNLMLEWLYNRRLFATKAGSARRGPEEIGYGYNLPRLLELEQQTHSAAIKYRIGECYWKGLGITQNEAEAVKWYRLAAGQGYATAQYCLGQMYQKGLGVRTNEKKAIIWYRLAADQGNADAQCNVGFFYEAGIGVAKDPAEAAKWYRLAAEQGNANAQNQLSCLYFSGRGVGQDYGEAAMWCRLAAEQGHASAQYNVGYLSEMGQGVTQDYVDAAKWYRLAAKQENADAQNRLGDMCRKGLFFSKNYHEAAEWYGLASDQGHATAQYNLGNLYRRGKGVAKDKERAHNLYKQAAAGGCHDAKKIVEKIEGRGNRHSKRIRARRLGYFMKPMGLTIRAKILRALLVLSLAGLVTVGAVFTFQYFRSKPTAISWNTRLSAWIQGIRSDGAMTNCADGQEIDLSELLELEKRNHSATIQNTIGDYCFHGDGSAQDYEEAAKWYWLAAKQGNAITQYNLGLLYENEYGAPKDLDAVISLYSQAAASDNTEVIVALGG